MVNWKSKPLIATIILSIVVVVSLGWVALSYLYRDRSGMYAASPLYRLFERAPYQKIIRRIDSHDKILLSGKEQDGLGVFLNYYLSIKDRPIKRRLLDKGSLEFEMNRAAGAFAEFIHKYITSKLWSSAAGNVWILDNGLNQLADIDMNAINGLMARHPEDKFIIVSTPTYDQLAGFKFIRHERPDDDELAKVLKQEGIDSKVMIKNILTYYEGHYQFIYWLLNNDSPNQAFSQIFLLYSKKIKDFTKNSEPAKNLLEQLCKQGTVQMQKQLKGISNSNGVVNFQQDAYYWTDYNYNFAYINDLDEQCQYASQISTYIPPLITPKVQQTQQEKKAKDKKSQSKRKTKKNSSIKQK